MMNERKKQTVLTSAHHEKLMNAIAEKDGLTRSAMLYALAEAAL
jgi:hypothetical protein